ncbi:hypothetical protein LSH36_900g00005 [Paralvinella palmiformis]|uniref:UBX domain-containing protein n=1 Tax=Paralvinella palmiformis TaxID=53620 RepID=A0AAD9IZD2_9ANNE|nr:hypothetical protein LSH36_900g00005 [Paralvinella palmiformis]
MAAIKRFFEKKKLDVKFKKAGGGHKLTEDTRSVPSVSAARGSNVTVERRARNAEETRKAAEAALARINQPRPGTGKGGPMPSLRSQIKEEMKTVAEGRATADLYSVPKEVDLEGAPVLAVTGVFFKCPLIGSEVLPKTEMEASINEFLLSQLAEEPQMTSALMIHTLNKDTEKVKVCIETLCKYLDNIISNPREEKFQKIRLNNKAFQERVLPLQGTEEFLQAAGFQKQLLPGPKQVEEDFYVLDEERAIDVEHLKGLKEILLTAEPIKPELDHNTKVFYPSPNANRIQVPESFYNVSAEELKKEQQIRQEAVEKLGMLRTKEMRERERQRELRRYRYTLIRVRFPDGILLQGTFRALDRLKALMDFVRESIVLDWVPFSLATSVGQKLTDEQQSLAELDLAPAAVVNIEFDKSVMSQIAAEQASSEIRRYLKDELLQHLEYI